MLKVIIFGATSSIASYCARYWIEKGNNVAIVGRNEDKLNNLRQDLEVRANPNQHVFSIVSDLSDNKTHEQILKSCINALGGADVILIAHGTLPQQQQCEKSVGETLTQININALSHISLLTHAANFFELQGQGVIAVITSVAGDRGKKSNYVYGASKAMVSTFLQGLRNRLSAFGVFVIDIKPGFVDTPMTSGFDKNGLLWAQPESVAKGIVNSVQKQKEHVYLPFYWKFIMLIIKNIPEAIFKKLSL